ncbi:MAG TPA: hypothetical protein VLT33_33705 [Labilithrix sp.]|nr:hypothetical protein [Labilithrix sp.]
MQVRTTRGPLQNRAALLLLAITLVLPSCKPKTREACMQRCDATRVDAFKYCDKHPSQRNCTTSAQDVHSACSRGCEASFPAK